MGTQAGTDTNRREREYRSLASQYSRKRELWCLCLLSDRKKQQRRCTVQRPTRWKNRFPCEPAMGGGTWTSWGISTLKRVQTTRSLFPQKPERVVLSRRCRENRRRNGQHARMPIREALSGETPKVETRQKKRTLVYRYVTPGNQRLPPIRRGSALLDAWGGVPDSIYNRTEGKNDYTDDLHPGCLGKLLAGGSPVLPQKRGAPPSRWTWPLHSTPMRAPFWVIPLWEHSAST